MAGTGWMNPFPLQFGGGETEIETTYLALRGAMGKGGVARSEDSIEAHWRQCKAIAIGSVRTFDERAANQAFPDIATDLVPYYERTLFDASDPTANAAQRRQELAAAWTDEAGGNQAELEAALQQIDSRFSIVTLGEDEVDRTHFGRRFQDLAASEPFGGGRISTAFPNYSTAFVLIALLELDGATELGPEELRIIARAQRMLAANLNAWTMIQVVTGFGFNLDEDFLDYTALYP